MEAFICRGGLDRRRDKSSHWSSQWTHSPLVLPVKVLPTLSLLPGTPSSPLPENESTPALASVANTCHRLQYCCMLTPLQRSID